MWERLKNYVRLHYTMQKEKDRGKGQNENRTKQSGGEKQ